MLYAFANPHMTSGLSPDNIGWDLTGVGVEIESTGLTAFAMKTNAYLPTWTDDVPYWRHITIANPNYSRGSYSLGSMLFGLGRLDEAQEQFQRTIAIAPNFVDAHYSLGLILAKSCRTEEACEHLTQAIRIDPSIKAARVNLAMYRK